MKLFDVNTQPIDGIRGQRREVADNAPLPSAPWERMTEAEFDAWLVQQPQIETVEPVERWRVSKDTLISRVVASGRLTDVMTALGSQSAEDQFIWNQSAWFWSDNPRIRGLCTVLSMDADALLAPDEFFQ